MTQNNPLQQFFRAIKLYVALPSGTTYYNDIEFNEDGEIGIMPMTAKDEMIIKNPDALLNGEAIVTVINSCVPAIKNPKALLSNDIDALLIAIRHASYGDDLEVNTQCPKCDAKNKFTVNITQSLSKMGKLEPEYFVGTKNGVKIFVKPFSYAEVVQSLKAQFDQHKLAQNLSNDKLPEEERLRVFSKNFETITDTNIRLITNCIIKITHEEMGLEVVDHDYILEFLQNVDKDTFSALDKLIQKINAIGTDKDFQAKCESCEHEWTANINFNPVTFFTNS